MNVIIHLTSVTNNGQPAVITADQPVFAVAKYIQWKFPSLYGEHKIVMMMGGLHIKMAIENMIGKWLAGSGWTDMLVKAQVATVGRCESMLKASHAKRTRYAHEVSLASLFIVRNAAFKSQVSETHDNLLGWMSRHCKESVSFLYWQTTIERKVCCYFLC